MKKWIIFLLVICLAVVAWAATNNTTNKAGRAYGASGSARSTAYAAWDNNKTYIDTYSFGSITVIFKMLSAAAETLIFNTMGSNHTPDSLKYYAIVRADTLKSTGTASTAWKGRDGIGGDSTLTITLPYGTGILTSVIPRYLKFQVILCDSVATVSTATIADGYVGK